MLTNNLKDLINEVKEDKSRLVNGSQTSIKETKRSKKLGSKVLDLFRKKKNSDS